ncbi:copper resistance D family protein [Actimicrobium sp. CCI2.3]|uniref:copper resistance D family protein n=1 Tax=Actimicrobium sp. CCI2.3 TaxID=3048616 RepID=UPI002AB47C0B|nr:CopD family protein [Actimicrobium sp. CCI2.3]MDY7573245.1 CopD family protein [Actimicrobium sp. CCI2.3]MEB0022879.1 CopD family protein [Actimicrobium sp. CCI2.3]
MIVLVALLNLALSVLVGATLAGSWLAGQPSGWAIAAARQAHGTARIAAGLTLLASLLVLWLQVAVMTELPLLSAAPAIVAVLSESHFGLCWLAGLAALVLILVLQSFHRQGAAMACALLVFAVSRALVSHAVMDGDLSWSVASESLHLLLISAWVGMVLVAGWIVLARPAATPADIDSCRRYARILSRGALLAFAGLLLTGVFNAWRAMSEVGQLVTTSWGLTLSAKLILVGIAVTLGAVNRWHLMPALLDGPDEDTARRRFVLNLRIEGTVLILAVIAAALLSADSPPGN